MKLSDVFVRDSLALAPTNTSITGQTPTTGTSTDIPEGLKAYQIPTMLLLFGDQEIVQREITNEVVCDSIIKCHPVSKICADTVDKEASSSLPFQHEVPKLLENIVNLSSQATLKQHVEINPASEDALLQRL